jgi:uridine kinase
MTEPRRLRADDLEGLASAILERARPLSRPCIVALDGRSGVGKSTLARALAASLGATVLDGDGFFAGGVSVRGNTPAERARDCIDWRRQRPVLESLRTGHGASYFAFDWTAFDGRLEREPTRVEPRPIVIFEGVYSGRPELADLIDMRVLLRVSEATRVQRLLAREGSIGPWERQWHEAEDWYFENVAPEDWSHCIAEG